MYKNRLGELTLPLLHGHRAKHKNHFTSFSTSSLDGNDEQNLELNSSYQFFKGAGFVSD